MAEGETSDPSTGEVDTSDPEEIQAEIDDTRAELGRTVEALAAKADVKAQARGVIAEGREKALDVRDRVSEMTPEDMRSSARSALTTAQQWIRERPAIAWAAGGLVVLWLLRRRR